MKDYISKFLPSTYDDLLLYGSTNCLDGQYAAFPTLQTISKILQQQLPTKEKCELPRKCKVST